MSNPSRWDIFCTVVDNFGDIGVTWRLARQLVAEHGLAIRLWVDNLATFISLCPEADLIERQFCQGVEVCHWSDPWCGAQPAQVVIEAFACELPAAYLEAMQASSERILWLNLEYLSAEAWVRDCHGLPSLHISGLQKYFFFPGFQADTGSLLREQDLLVQRSAFQADLAAQQAFLQSLNIPWQPGAWWVSLFAYENAALAEWLDSLACGPQMTQLLIPVGRVLPDVARWLGVEALNAGDRYQQDAVHIHVLPFLTQDQYDRLLWCCDFNAVRGEESFIRAQWAARPLVWHIYPQEDDAHWLKLTAFLACYTAGLESCAQQALTDFWQAWNAGQGVGRAWLALVAHWPALQAQAERWAKTQQVHGDLAGKLVSFYSDWV